jgi:hypothetical protein
LSSDNDSVAAWHQQQEEALDSSDQQVDDPIQRTT